MIGIEGRLATPRAPVPDFRKGGPKILPPSLGGLF